MAGMSKRTLVVSALQAMAWACSNNRLFADWLQAALYCAALELGRPLHTHHLMHLNLMSSHNPEVVMCVHFHAMPLG